MKYPPYPSFPYHGGKSSLRRWIVSFIPVSRGVYIEPFAGRGNVFWYAYYHRRRFSGWWLNDLQTKSFFTAILKVDVDAIPSVFLPEERDLWRKRRENNDHVAIMVEPILAWGGGVLPRSYNVPWKWNRRLYVERILEARRVLEESSCRLTDFDCLDVLRQAGEHDFVYLDPPYLGASVTAYSESTFDPVRMVELLQKAKFKWILSEYRHPFYLRALGEPVRQKKCMMSLASYGVNRVHIDRKRVECLWSNFVARGYNVSFPSLCPQYSSG